MLDVTNQIQCLVYSREISSRIDMYVRQMYRQLDRKIKSFGNKCDNCKRCCNFQESKLDLFVSNIEFSYFVMNVSESIVPEGNVCPYLSQSGCSVREFRPIGCRIYFCNPNEGYLQSDIYESSLNDIKKFVGELGLPYGYYRWINVLEEYSRRV